MVSYGEYTDGIKDKIGQKNECDRYVETKMILDYVIDMVTKSIQFFHAM